MAHFHSDNFKTFLRASTAAAALVWGGYTAGFAATLDITGIDAASDLYETVSGGSLLREETAEDADPTTQELLAAAQADYARLLAVLYDKGYFAAVIKITLDGVCFCHCAGDTAETDQPCCDRYRDGAKVQLFKGRNRSCGAGN